MAQDARGSKLAFRVVWGLKVEYGMLGVGDGRGRNPKQ